MNRWTGSIGASRNCWIFSTRYGRAKYPWRPRVLPQRFWFDRVIARPTPPLEKVGAIGAPEGRLGGVPGAVGRDNPGQAKIPQGKDGTLDLGKDSQAGIGGHGDLPRLVKMSECQSRN